MPGDVDERGNHLVKGSRALEVDVHPVGGDGGSGGQTLFLLALLLASDDLLLLDSNKGRNFLLVFLQGDGRSTGLDRNSLVGESKGGHLLLRGRHVDGLF